MAALNIWHKATGLDADLLDGLHADEITTFLPADAVAISAGVV